MNTSELPTKETIAALSTTAQPPTQELVCQKGNDVEVTAFTPDEMKQANSALILWCERKITEMKADASELLEAFKQAVEKKWKSSTLKRHSELALKRVTFYEKMKSALENGFYIVPNFPVTCFAIRTEKGKPFAMMDTQRWGNKEQHCQALPEGEGTYQNPFPVIMQRDVTDEEQKAQGKKVFEYFADAWKELEFPIQMSKPHIMDITSRAMGLKLFDDFGVLPGRTKTDPIVVGRILDPRSNRYNRRFVTFIIAWHLDTSVL